MIGRENYEIWFMDFLDGKLTPEQIHALRHFLAQNPDLEAELAEASGEMPTLWANDVLDTTPLKRQIVPVGSLHADTFETAFIAYHEGDLDAAGQTGVDKFLVQNPFLQAEFDAYAKIRVAPSGETFPHKNRLKHRPVIIPLVRYAAAASLLLLIGLGVVRYTGQDETTGEGLAYRPVPLGMPAHPEWVAVNPLSHGEETVQVSSHKNKISVPAPEPRRMNDVAVNESVSSVALSTGGFEGSLKQMPVTPRFVAVGEPIPAPVPDDALTVVQVMGKVLENGVGKNSVSDGLKNDRKVTAGDMVDLASTPFRKPKEPVLATDNSTGHRRIKLRLGGFFEADFVLQ